MHCFLEYEMHLTMNLQGRLVLKNAVNISLTLTLTLTSLPPPPFSLTQFSLERRTVNPSVPIVDQTHAFLARGIGAPPGLRQPRPAPGQSKTDIGQSKSDTGPSTSDAGQKKSVAGPSKPLPVKIESPSVASIIKNRFFLSKSADGAKNDKKAKVYILNVAMCLQTLH